MGCPSPVSGWRLLPELKMRKEAAFVQSRRSSVFVTNLLGHVCLPISTLMSPGPCYPEHAHWKLGHQSSRREHFFLWESVNERPICSQSESFGFGKVCSFQQGRVGTRKELMTPEKEEVRVKGGRKELQRPKDAQLSHSVHFPTSLVTWSACLSPRSQPPVVLAVASCCLGKQSWQEMMLD